MELLATENLMLAFLTSNSILNSSVDWLFKSAVIIGFTAGIVFLLRNKLSSSSKHLLWLNSLACIALVPLISALYSTSVTSPLNSAHLISVQINSPSLNFMAADIPGNFNWTWMAVTIYLIPASFFLLRLLVSIVKAIRFTASSEVASESWQVEQMMQWQVRLGISRSVQLRYSSAIISPLSIGSIRPTIILPMQAKSWNADFLDDVLIHELSHIKRLDWITMLLAHIVAYVIWINPLAWLVLRRLDEEAENSCDSAVLRIKGKETQYAETLFKIARDIKQTSNSPVFAQTMLGKTSLSSRIHRILENNMASSTSHRLFVIPLLVLVLVILATCTSTQLMNTESPRRPPPPRDDSRALILPITHEAPQYPLTAAVEGIEGWVLLEFDVLQNGDVEQDSIEVVDAEPPGIFNRASMRAAERFKFEPVGGVAPQEINDVQYLFRFALDDENSSSNSINRNFLPTNSVTPVFPAEARTSGIAGGNVWTVFHVTRAGAVQDVMVNYSSNEVFNTSAIAAAQQLQFRPRSAYDNVQGNVRGDTTGLVRAQYLFRFE